MEIILGIFTVLGGISALWFFNDKLFSRKEENTQDMELSKVNETLERETIVGIIENYYGTKFSLLDYSYCDISNSGNKNEIVIKSSNDQNVFIDVFSNKHENYENIFHYKAEPDEIVDAYIHTFNNKNFFIYSTQAGSGGFLDIFIYSYDNISKLGLRFKKIGLYQGAIFFIPDKVLLSGNNKKYELILKDSNFKMIPYKKKLLGSISDSSHILSFEKVGKILRVSLNGKQLKFTKENDNYISSSKINIRLNDQIYIDDNFIENNSNSFKLLVNGSYFTFNDGLFYTIKPIRKGVGSVSAQLNFSWYNIVFKIK